MANSTVTVKGALPASLGVIGFGFGETVGPFSVQITNYGPGIVAVGGDQSTYTSAASTGHAVLVYPGQVSPVFWSDGATEANGTSDLCQASLGDVNGDETVLGYTYTILG